MTIRSLLLKVGGVALVMLMSIVTAYALVDMGDRASGNPARPENPVSFALLVVILAGVICAGILYAVRQKDEPQQARSAPLDSRRSPAEVAQVCPTCGLSLGVVAKESRLGQRWALQLLACGSGHGFLQHATPPGEYAAPKLERCDLNEAMNALFS